MATLQCGKPMEGNCPKCGAPVRDVTETSLILTGRHHGEPWPVDMPKPDVHALECTKCDWETVIHHNTDKNDAEAKR